MSTENTKGVDRTEEYRRGMAEMCDLPEDATFGDISNAVLHLEGVGQARRIDPHYRRATYPKEVSPAFRYPSKVVPLTPPVVIKK